MLVQLDTIGLSPTRRSIYMPQGALLPPGSNHVTVVDRRGNVATILHSPMSLPWPNGLFAKGVSIAASGAHFYRIGARLGARWYVTSP